MKIAIITFHRAINYGGILQAYALQNVISEIGYDCDILDYYCPFIEEQYRSRKVFSKIRMKRFISTILKNGNLKRNNEGFFKFTEKYLKLSEEIYTPDNIIEANKIYDIFITGSDQVWSPTCAGFDKNYFLDFVDDYNIKMSYAASFGGALIPNNLVEEYKKLLKSFSSISVREESGIKIINDLLQKKAELVLDPTLLLEKNKWSEKFLIDLKSTNNYVLIYMISEDKELIECAKKYAKENDLKVLYINDRLYKTRGVNNLKKVNPDMWVSLFLNAQCVFTNSFHGVAFAINFEKEFYVFKLKQNKNVNERIYNILNIFELNERMISEFNDIKSIKKIDLKKNKELLANYRTKSIEYLRKTLDNKK